MLNIALLLSPIDPAQRADDLITGDERLEEISQLVVDGEYLQAADRCQQLLESRHYDARLVGYFLFGVFLEQGIAALPDVLSAVHRCLGPNHQVLGPAHKRDVLLDGALQWLFTSLLKQIERSEQAQDAAWQALIEVKNIERVKQMTSELVAIAELAAKLVKRPRSVQAIAHLEQVLNQAYSAIQSSAESMRLSALSQVSAGARSEARADEQAGDTREGSFDTSDQESGGAEDEELRGGAGAAAGDGDADEAREGEDEGGQRGLSADAEHEPAGGSPEEEGSDEATERPRLPHKAAPRATTPARAPERAPARASERATVRTRDAKGSSITIEGAPALLELVRRIQAFQTLCKRGDVRKAAVVADSVLGTLDAFDPRVFFPSLFLPFFSLLSEHAEEIEMAMSERDSLTFKSLQQLMQVNIDALLK